MANSGGAIVSIHLSPFEDGVFTVEKHGLKIGDVLKLFGTDHEHLNGYAKVVYLPDPAITGIPDANWERKFQCIWFEDPYDPDNPVQRNISFRTSERGYWILDTSESDAGCATCYDCRNLECLAHAEAVFSWRGDFDFTDHRDITQFARFNHKVIHWQEQPTMLVWRIRVDRENCGFVQERRYYDGYPLLTHDPDANTIDVRAYWTGLDSVRDDDVIAIGPVRKNSQGIWQLENGGCFESWCPTNKTSFDGGAGQSGKAGEYEPWEDRYTFGLTEAGGYGTLIGYAEHYPAAGGQQYGASCGFPFADWRFIGSAWEGRGFIDPYSVFQQYPWRLEIGAIRCPCNSGLITWPKMYRREIGPRQYAVEHVDNPLVTFEPPRTFPTLQQPWWWARLPDEDIGEYSTHTHRLIAAEESHDVDEREVMAAWWNGSRAEPFEPNDARSSPCKPDSIIWAARGSYGTFSTGTLPTIGTYSRGASTARWFGWCDDLADVQSLESCDYEKADIIYLSGAVGSAQFGLPSRYLPDASRLADWLLTGGKCLILENPGAMMGAPTSGGYAYGADIANDFLAALGSTIQYASELSIDVDDEYDGNCYGQFGEDPLSVVYSAEGLDNVITMSEFLGVDAIANPIVSAPRVLNRLRVVQRVPVVGTCNWGSGSLFEAILCAAETIGDSLIIASSGGLGSDFGDSKVTGDFFPGNITTDFGDRIRAEINSPAAATP